MEAVRPSILMGDPTYFKIKGGANPFTRNRYGLRKQVDKNKAIQQWHKLARILTELGVDVYVVPPAKEAPGLVYPANAGIVATGGTFVLSRLIESRQNEIPYYKQFLRNLGLETAKMILPFEGEADFFPFKDKMIFTYGKIVPQHFAFQWHFPPWKRVYGFRSTQKVEPELKEWVRNKEIISLELINESYYHGDTALCPFSPGKEKCLVYPKVIQAENFQPFYEKYAASLVLLSDEDAAIYAANSFYVEVNGKSFLIMPEGVSRALIEKIENELVQVVTVDVSEFWKKGGGSVKCMIGQLPPLPLPRDDSVKQFREKHLFR